MTGENFPMIRSTPIYRVWKRTHPRRWSRFFPYLLIILAILLWFATAHAYSDEQIVNAIYHAEGGSRATYAYGIRSVPYRDIAEARRICFNTVRNNRKRFARQSFYTDFIEFLGSRYCPVSAHPKNRYWVSNVRYFLAKGGR